MAAAVGWPLVLVLDGAMNWEWGLLGSAGLAAANTAVGVLVHQGGRLLVRLFRTPGSDYVDKLG